MQSGRKEKDVIEELGNPRLIAKTLIESGSYQNNNYSNSFNSSDKYDYQDSSYSNDYGDNSSKKRKGLVSIVLANLTWKQKLKLFLLIALVIICIAIPFIYAIGMVVTFVKIVFSFIVKFIVPITIILGGYYIYKVIKS